MVVGVITGSGFRGAIGYALKDQKLDELKASQKPEIITQNNVYGKAAQMARQMRFVANTNNRVSVPVMHFYVSFDVKEQLTESQYEKAVNGVLKELGVKNTDHQYLIVKHNDAKNPHYHIILNKVDLDGKKLNVGFEGKKEEFIQHKCHVIADKIEQEQGLKRTVGRKIIYDPSSPKGYRKLSKEELTALEPIDKKESISKNPHKREQEGRIKSEVMAALQNKEISSPEEFKTLLEQKGIDVRFMENRNGISGVSFKNDTISVKGSQIGAKWGDISKVLDANRVLAKGKEEKVQIEEKAPEKTNVAVLQNVIHEVGKNKSIVSFAQFNDVLGGKGIEVEVREDKNGLSVVVFSSDKMGVEPLETSVSLSSVSAFLIANLTTAISNKIQSIETYITDNAAKAVIPLDVVDDAIRTIMLEVNPGANPWETWRTNLEHETLYSSLVEFADKVPQEQQQVSAPEECKPIDVSIPGEREVLFKEIFSDEKVVSAELLKSALEGYGVSVEYKPGPNGSAVEISLNGIKLSSNELLDINKILRLNGIISDNKVVLLDIPQDFRGLTAQEEVVEKLVDSINGRVDVLIDRVETVLKNAYEKQTAIQGEQVAKLIESCGFYEDLKGNFVLKNQHDEVLFRVSKYVILSPLKQFNEQLKEYQTAVTKYVQLMDEKPQKLPFLIGRDQVIKKNEALRVKQEKVVQPKFALNVWKIDRRSLLQETPYRKAMAVHKEAFTQQQTQNTERSKKASVAVLQKQEILSQGIVVVPKQNRMRYK